MMICIRLGAAEPETSATYRFIIESLQIPDEPNGIPLHFKRSPFATQNDPFCLVKRVLLQRKRTPFEERKESF